MAESKTTISINNILDFEQRYRATFINSLSGFKSVNLIGTKDRDNNENLAIFSSVVHIGANPPLIGFIVRPDSVDRHTLTNILTTQSYTLNHINDNIFNKAHQTSARYPKEESEFEAVGLTPEYKNECFAPFVKESNVQIEMEFKEKVDLKINGTSLIIGQIKSIHLPLKAIQEDGFIDLEQLNTITCSGLDSYHKTQQLNRLSYAKPNQNLKIIK